jgi:hypothetical protein
MTDVSSLIIFPGLIIVSIIINWILHKDDD